MKKADVLLSSEGTTGTSVGVHYKILAGIGFAFGGTVVIVRKQGFILGRVLLVML